MCSNGSTRKNQSGFSNTGKPYKSEDWKKTGYFFLAAKQSKATFVSIGVQKMTKTEHFVNDNSGKRDNESNQETCLKLTSRKMGMQKIPRQL